MQSKGKYN